MLSNDEQDSAKLKYYKLPKIQSRRQRIGKLSISCYEEEEEEDDRR